MARKTNPLAGCGSILMIIGFAVLVLFDLIGGIILFVVGAVIGLIGVLAGIICDIFGWGQDDSGSRIIIVEQKDADKKSEKDEDGWVRDVPAWLRDPKPKSPKAKRPQPKRKKKDK